MARPTLRITVPALVLAVLQEKGEAWEWTTRELAEVLNVSEYAVRGSVSTLLIRAEVRAAGRITRYTTGGLPYFVITYRWTGPRCGTPDVSALYRAFGLG